MSKQCLYFSFNEEESCFSLGTSVGFEIWNVNPCSLRYKRDLACNVHQVELLRDTNIVALVYGNKVCIWDDLMQRKTAELEFRSLVQTIKIYSDTIMVTVKEGKFYLYSFPDLRLNFCSELGTILPSRSQTLLAYSNLKGTKINLRQKEGKTKTFPSPHNHKLSLLKLNRRASLLACASERGTKISILNVQDGERIASFRRGKDSARITFINFSSDDNYVCVNSDRGTLHIFSLCEQNKVGSSLRSISTLLPSSLEDYATSNFSFAQVHGLSSQAQAIFDKSENGLIHILDDERLTTYYFLEGGEARKERSFAFSCKH